MGEPVEVLRLTCVHYDDGSSVWVELRPEMSELLRKLDQAAERRERRRKSREQTFTELGIDPGQIASPWMGPRMRFSWLVGESRTWNGEPRVELDGERYCLICMGAVLPPNAYCLGCDRTGRELEIPGAEGADSSRPAPARFRPKGAVS